MSEPPQSEYHIVHQAYGPPREARSPVILSPSRRLIFTEEGRGGDWRENLFNLAAGRTLVTDPVKRFWRGFSEYFIISLCRLADDDPRALAALAPDLNRLARMADGAPPMAGGEYLSAESLAEVWRQLLGWVLENSAAGLGAFLAGRAPQWSRVGRVTFHLAENKGSESRPFAFMATYVTSLTSDGRDMHQQLYRALADQLGEMDGRALRALLRPVNAAAERLEWVGEMVLDKTVYRPSAFTVAQAHRFLQDIPVLEECGLTVRIPDWWRRRQQLRLNVTVGERRAAGFGLETVLDWDVHLSVGSRRVSREEYDEIMAGEDGGLVLFKGEWLEVDRERLEEALDHWEKVRSETDGDGLTFARAMRLLAGIPGGDDDDGHGGEPGETAWVVPRAGAALEEILGRMRSPGALDPPAELLAVLRPYQREGLAWLKTLSGLGLGACLADDMGLGKTMQVLALLLLLKKEDPGAGPSLLVAPASLLSNWRSEAKKFAPSLRLAIFHPSETSRDTLERWEADPESLRDKFDLVVISYAMVHRKKEALAKFAWRLVILDEAQAIKNPDTAQSRAVRQIPGLSRVILTGTPVENNLTDLWSLFNFLNPGLLGGLKKFAETVSMLEASGASDVYAPLRRLVSPYLLRRLKTDRRIITELPDKIERNLTCYLTNEQAKLYATVVREVEEALQTAEFKGPLRNTLVLRSLMRLKQVVNHPAQLTGDANWLPERSGKFMCLAELCQEMSERQDRLLLFTQFKEIIPALEAHLADVFGAPGLVLHGSTPVAQRRRIVETFQSEDGPPFLILSLKAGGVGLNLTNARQVVHFDRWWNPAVEDQATDRAYRIGQKKNVLVHKCVTQGTLEENIDALLKSKRQLAEDILGSGDEASILKMDNREIMRLISLDLDRAVL
ncbi:MAG: DEAD/DEAH box helicase [Deltaproteobacteria bacterium]|nr:DEAD/DEAH box helicase [Deltaproteobacteria bacterium]